MRYGFRTLDVLQQALVYNVEGEGRVEKGPKRIFLFREKFVPLRSYTASQNQFLKIQFRNGKLQHKPGPCTVFQNPLEHTSIQVEDGISLSANEVLVVYRQAENGQVERYLKHGPTLFIIGAHEWLHEFCWHGPDPQNKTRKLAGSLKFTKLQVIPDQFYYNVDEVRTSDDALIRVKLMIFYELINIEHMLQATQDPIADFINCLEADIVAFASKLTYAEFMEQSNALNELSSYPQLMQRSKTIGYDVSKVVFRGYFASPTLQAMHDNAIQAHTKLKIAFETEMQEQEFTDNKLKNEFNRQTTEQKIELETQAHKHRVEKSAAESRLLLEQQRHEERLKREEKEFAAKMAAKADQTQQQTAFYSDLAEMKVDITEYLLSRNPHPNKITRVVAEDSAGSIHLHQNIWGSEPQAAVGTYID